MPFPGSRSRCWPRRAVSCALLLVAWLGLVPDQMPAPASAQTLLSPGSPSRGRLLYETHCIACHNSQMHWRDQRLARDWDGLVAQVRGWQARASLGWNDDDVLEVARHLNDIVYRFERPVPPRPVVRAPMAPAAPLAAETAVRRARG